MWEWGRDRRRWWGWRWQVLEGGLEERVVKPGAVQ
jgi:hypothetical protein